MASIQHVYRRGHTFWWRRVLRLFNGRIFDIRLSLGTADRQRARELGAVLTAASSGVKVMLHEQITRRADSRPAEAELQAIAKAEFQNQLARYCDQQREHPQHHRMHSAANEAYADYYQRMIETGGRPVLEPFDETDLVSRGYSAERIDRLNTLIQLHSDRPAIQPNTAIQHLRQLGFEPNKILIETVKRALYPAYRDAALAAQEQLEEMLADRPRPRMPVQADVAPAAAPSDPAAAAPAPAAEPATPVTGAIVPDDSVNPTFAQLCRDAAIDKEVEGAWTAKTARQRRSLGLLFELLVGEKRIADLTQADLSTFKAKRRLITEKLNPASEADRKRIVELATRSLTPQELKGLDGPHAKTINRDLTGISAVLAWGKDNGKAVPAVSASGLRVATDRSVRARDDRPPTSAEDLSRLFNLPVFTGCLPHQGGRGRRVLNCRFAAGTAIVHDAFYWVPLIVTYTGVRREEACKFRPADFELDCEVPYLRVEATETGRIKNAQSKRNLPLHPELLRLGFVEYIREAIRRGYEVLFPELTSTNAVETYGDQFYDLCWTHMRKHGGLSEGADIHGIRHAFNSDLKQKRVTKEFRADMLGHGGEGQTDERYSTAAGLQLMLEEMTKLPVLTSHLTRAELNMPRPPVLRPNPNMRRHRPS
jgi:integrase